MKKIFTLLFFVGCLTSAFAQQDRHQQYGTQTNNNRNQHAYSKPYGDHNGYNKNDQWDKRNHENDYGYSKERDRRNREVVRRDQYPQPECIPQRRIEDNSYNNRPAAPLIKILFNIGGIFK